MAAILPVYYRKIAGANLSGNKTTFFWGYTVSIALLITAFISPIMGAIVDSTGAKERFLMMFAAIGIFFPAGAILLSNVDVKRGIQRARDEDMNVATLLNEN